MLQCLQEEGRKGSQLQLQIMFLYSAFNQPSRLSLDITEQISMPINLANDANKAISESDIYFLCGYQFKYILLLIVSSMSVKAIFLAEPNHILKGREGKGTICNLQMIHWSP
jgi:hypothetical protein